MRNIIAWRLYENHYYSRLTAVLNNFKIYLNVLLNCFSKKLSGKKVIVVFLLYRSHYEWIKDVVINLKNARTDISFQFFSPDDISKIKLDGPVYSTKNIIPTKCVPIIPSLWADLFITPASTTADNTPLTGPRVMFMHSLVSLHGVYEDNTFDGYDYIYCTGKHHVEEFRELFLTKKLSGKCLITGGYPKLDELLTNIEQLNSPKEKTVIFAPTLLSKATEAESLIFNASSLIEWFGENGWSVIFRPHPLNLDPSNAYFYLFDDLFKKYQETFWFSIDTSKDYLHTYAQSSIMISDVSGTAYTYAFGFCRPVIFWKIPDESNFAKGLLYRNRNLIGRSIASDIELGDAINFLAKHYTTVTHDIQAFRNDCIFNLGSSAEYFSENIDYILNNKIHPDWVYV